MTIENPSVDTLPVESTEALSEEQVVANKMNKFVTNRPETEPAPTEAAAKTPAEVSQEVPVNPEDSARILQNVKDYSTYRMEFLSAYLDKHELQVQNNETINAASELLILNSGIEGDQAQVDYTKQQIRALQGETVNPEFGISGGYHDKWQTFARELPKLSDAAKESLAEELSSRVARAESNIAKASKIKTALEKAAEGSQTERDQKQQRFEELQTTRIPEVESALEDAQKRLAAHKQLLQYITMYKSFEGGNEAIKPEMEAIYDQMVRKDKMILPSEVDEWKAAGVAKLRDEIDVRLTDKVRVWEASLKRDQDELESLRQ